MSLRRLIVSTRIPTGFHPSAQGCEARATLGNRRKQIVNPNGVVSSFKAPRIQPRWGWNIDDDLRTQGSSFVATLGWMPQSLRDWQTPAEALVFQPASSIDESRRQECRRYA